MISFFENGWDNFSITPNESYSFQIDTIIDRYKLNDSFFPDVDLNVKIQNVIVGHLNIYYLRNKPELLKHFICNAFDILIVSESKIDCSFSSSKFRLTGHRTFTHDKNSFGGDLCMNAKEKIPAKQVSFLKDDDQNYF